MDTPQVLEAMQWHENLMQRERIMHHIANAAASFVDGKVAMIGRTYFNFKTVELLPKVGDKFKWDGVMMPKHPKTGKRGGMFAGDAHAVTKATKAPDAAWELLKFLQSDEWTDVATKVVGQQSARKSFQQRWLAGIKEANPKMADKNLKPLAEAVEKNYARPIELFRKQVEANTEFVNAYNKSVRDGDEEVATAMRAAAELVNQINKS
jgi:ABC-type glycerol-3-phosphate transport system substrate-binding protein